MQQQPSVANLRRTVQWVSWCASYAPLSHLHIKGKVADKDGPVALIHHIAPCPAMCTLPRSVYTDVQTLQLQ